MTAQTPAPKAGSASTLLASLDSVPPLPQPTIKDDFLAMILQALTAQPSGPQTATPAPAAKEKPSAPEAAAPNPTAAGLLLALLAPPWPVLSKAPAHKASAPSSPVVPLVPESGPAQSGPGSKPDKTAAAEKTPPLPIQSMTPKEAETKNPPPNGTSTADTNQRMTLTSERNEIAGRLEQKLPPEAVPAVTGADTGGPSPDGRSSLPFSFSWHEASSESLPIINIPSQATGPVVKVMDSPIEAPVRSVSTAPLERLEQMITREAVTIRQMGAQTLDVSLKLDSNTQLSLQLTTNNGLTQASVRVDRGQFTPEDSQWAQLTQSLARQNVELLPMTGGSNLGFEQPSQERQRQLPTQPDWPETTATVPPTQARQQKEQNRPRNNWELWA